MSRKPCKTGCTCKKHTADVGRKCLDNCKCGRHRESAHQKNREAHLGKKQSKETIDKRIATRIANGYSRKGKTLEEIYGVDKAATWRNNLSESHIGNEIPLSTRLAVVASWTLERRKAWGEYLAQKNREQVWTEERKLASAQRLAELKRSRPSKIESVLLNNLIYIYGPDQVKHLHPILRYIVDCAVPSLKLVFEADGEYWHDVEADKIRDENINNEGWQVFRFPERTLNRWIKLERRSIL